MISHQLSSSVINKPRHRRRTTNHRDIASLQDGEELYEAMGDDPAYLEVMRYALCIFST